LSRNKAKQTDKIKTPLFYQLSRNKAKQTDNKKKSLNSLISVLVISYFTPLFYQLSRNKAKQTDKKNKNKTLKSPMYYK